MSTLNKVGNTNNYTNQEREPAIGYVNFWVTPKNGKPAKLSFEALKASNPMHRAILAALETHEEQHAKSNKEDISKFTLNVEATVSAVSDREYEF